MRRDEENSLERSVGAAFDRLPEPEAARLEALERRLAERAGAAVPRRRTSTRFWWLMAGLVATGAAAWWGGENWREPESRHESRPVQPDADATTGRENAPGPDRKGTARQLEGAEPGSDNDSPTIFRREVY